MDTGVRWMVEWNRPNGLGLDGRRHGLFEVLDGWTEHGQEPLLRSYTLSLST